MLKIQIFSKDEAKRGAVMVNKSVNERVKEKNKRKRFHLLHYNKWNKSLRFFHIHLVYRQ